MPSSAFLLYVTATVLAACGLLQARPLFPAGPVSIASSKTYCNNTSESPPLERRAITMTRWGKDGSAFWGFLTPGMFVTAANNPNYARQGYEALTSMPAAKSKFKKDGDGQFELDLIVAALFVPGKGVFLGSSAGQEGYHFVAANAPAWWQRVKDRRVLVDGRSKYHAEDLAMYQFETSLVLKLPASAQYPDGSTISIYGHFQQDTVASRKNICGIGGVATIDPSCYNIARDLDIAFP